MPQDLNEVLIHAERRAPVGLRGFRLNQVHGFGLPRMQLPVRGDLPNLHLFGFAASV